MDKVCDLVSRGLCCGLLGALVGVVSLVSPVQGQPLRLRRVATDGVRIDGALGDWRAVEFTSLDGDGDGPDAPTASLKFALGYDLGGMYLAADVRDDRVVRTKRATRSQDAVVITLALPGRGGRLIPSEVWVYPGVTGQLRALVARGGFRGRLQVVRRARVVEGPRPDGRSGYLLEAYIPWRHLPGGRSWDAGRGSVRLVDVDREVRPEVRWIQPRVRIDPRRLDRMPALIPEGRPAAMLHGFLASRGLEETRPTFDLHGDVAGDRRRERVLIVGGYVVVLGPGYRKGQAFDVYQLPVSSGVDVQAARLRDLTADRKRELAVRFREHNDRGSRDVWQVFDFTRERIRPLWGTELRKQTADGVVEAELKVRRARRGAPRIEVQVKAAEGLDAATYREAPARDVEPVLLPWGAVAARTYQWNAGQFTVVAEEENEAATEPTPSPRPATRPPGPVQRPSSEPARTAPRRVPKPTVEALVQDFKRRAGLSSTVAPERQLSANVAEGREVETVMVFGRRLLVVGPGFRGGTRWFHFEIPVAADDDVLDLQSIDLSGDRREELLLRVRRHAGDVARELLLIRQFRPKGFVQLASMEVARTQGDRRIENEVRLRRGRKATLELHPGRSQGWAATSWPFADGTDDGVAPLLLPWRDQPVRYRYRRGQLLRAPDR